MKLRFHPFVIELRKPFSIAAGTRSTTDAVLVEVEDRGSIGYGEASLPPYLPESQESVLRFLSDVVLPDLVDEGTIDQTLNAVEKPGNSAAMAAVDMALHDLVGKQGGFQWHQRWGLDEQDIPPSSFTIGMDSPEAMRESVREASEFSFLKVKLGGNNDDGIIKTVREVSDQPIRVDVNQGWSDRSKALKMIEWLAERNVELVEQPMPKDRINDLRWLKERSPLPIVADEGMATMSEVRELAEVYDGVNVKLMKCGGMSQAHEMIRLARNCGLKVMLGCMTETTCAISAAAQLAPLADWIDLDGALLIKNDPFTGSGIEEGRVRFAEGNGNGVSKRV